MCQNERVKDADKCIHCHVCQENCSFLKKYGLDIGDTEKLNKLAYHCFYVANVQKSVRWGLTDRESLWICAEPALHLTKARG